MYKLKLQNFEGPLDLLLYFIKRDELNIYDIPIAGITAEFLKYIRLMKEFDLELAGEFIVMAATLMFIKAQMLLPKDHGEGDDEDAEMEDPRTQLVAQLLEYKRFKEAAADLRELDDSQRWTYYRQLFSQEKTIAANAATNGQNAANFSNATMLDLMYAVERVLRRKSAEEDNRHTVKIFPVTVEEKSHLLLNDLAKSKRLMFSAYVAECSRAVVVVTFLAILELLRKRLIFVIQNSIADDIIITGKPDDDGYNL